MRKILSYCITIIFGTSSFSQKPAIDTSVFQKWYIVDNGTITDDGKYACYTIRDSRGDTLVFASTSGSWKQQFPQSAGAILFSNSKYAVFKTRGDSLWLLQLGTKLPRYIGSVTFYVCFKDKSNREWLVYQDIGKDKILIVRDIRTGKTLSKGHISRYVFNEVCGIMLLLVDEGQGEQSLCRWNLLTDDTKIIWKGHGITDYAFDDSGQQIAFLSEEQSKYHLWYYRTGMDQAEKWVSDSAGQFDDVLSITDEPPVFSKNGKNIFFQLRQKPTRDAVSGEVKVDIWSYKDLRLQEDQLVNIPQRTFSAAVSTEDKIVHRLQMENETFSFNINLKNCNEYLLVTKNGDNIDLWWQPKARSSVYLESVSDGKKILLKDNIPYAHDWFQTLDFIISPSEKYVVYYDPYENNYFSYEIATKITRNITLGVDARWRGHSDRWAVPVCGYPEGIAGWMERDAAVLIYDAFDIWEIDPSGEKKPVNITNSFGIRNHTILRLVGNPRFRKPLAFDSQISMRAFDTVTKYSGFYNKSLNVSGDPKLVVMGPYVYADPIKAEKADLWIVQRQSAVDAPNYYSTKNWRSFIAVSDVHPQYPYNWLTSELIAWTLPDGRKTQGILYKPENFNSHRKYPLLVHYYEERSNELYEFKKPDVIRDEINIPYFVSRGYIVFIPDIHYKMGTPGEDVVNTVLSGVRYVCQNAWVDSSRIGLQGHSFGGWETNYLVTHTHFFAAAVEGAGTSDLISSYGGLARGQSRHFGYEIYQGRIRESLWQEPNLYINGSPIFKADQVTTPLLMMHNKKDEAVPWAQAVEFFTALRRLGKKVWMLQYDNGTHAVDGKEAMDYTMRITQFFDYYLKGCAAPKWMTEGITANKKGQDMGFELDEADKIP